MARKGTKKNVVQRRAPASRPTLDDCKLVLRAALIVAQVQGLLLFRLFNPARKAELAGVEDAAKEAVLRLAMQPD